MLNISEWEYRYKRVFYPTLLQDYTYGKTLCVLNNQAARWGLIEIDGQEAGIVQALEARVFGGLLHAIIIDRGPLWFGGFGSTAHFKGFIEEFNRQFPRRVGRKCRFIPEIKDNAHIQTLMQEHGFKKSQVAGYQTIWIDLSLDLNDLRQNLKKNWRSALSKAEKDNMQIEWDETGQYLSWLLKVYDIDKKEKNYDGPSIKLLRTLGQEFAKEKKLLIGRALIDNKPISAILVLCHGHGATYQVGWTSPQGRECNAHHFLLWNVLKVLKDKNISYFDLGGVNDESAKGVKAFKEGMGGKVVSLAGLYT